MWRTSETGSELARSFLCVLKKLNERNEDGGEHCVVKRQVDPECCIEKLITDGLVLSTKKENQKL